MQEQRPTCPFASIPDEGLASTRRRTAHDGPFRAEQDDLPGSPPVAGGSLAARADRGRAHRERGSHPAAPAGRLQSRIRHLGLRPAPRARGSLHGAGRRAVLTVRRGRARRALRLQDQRAPAAGASRESAPDLAIEVLSPSSARIDKVRKLRLYERHGVNEYWLADPATDTLEVYRLTAGGRLALQVSLSHAAGDVLETPLLAGLHIALSEIFGR